MARTFAPALVVLLGAFAAGIDEFGRKEDILVEIRDAALSATAVVDDGGARRQRRAALCPERHGVEDDTVASCLTDNNVRCDPYGRRCATAQHYPRTCLRARIPVGTPISRIQCCFACCLKVWLGRFKLLENDRFWRASSSDKPSSYGPLSIVHHSFSSTSLSSIAYNYHRGKNGWRRDGRECVHGNCTLPRGAMVTVNKALCGRGDKVHHQCNLVYFAEQRMPHMGGRPFVLITTADNKLPRYAP